MTTVYFKDVTGIPPVPTKRPRLSAEATREFRVRECEKIAARLAVYQGSDIYIDMRGSGAVHQEGDDNAPEHNDRLRISEHLERQVRVHGNRKFATIRHDDGQLLAVSLAEFVGLGKPEA